MKNLYFFVAAILCGTVIFAAEPADTPPAINWSLLWSGSWEESASASLVSMPFNGTLHNRGEIKLNILPLDLLIRAQVLDRRPFNLNWDSPWGDPDKEITHFTGGLYHVPTGSKLLFGVLDEWGLPARIRNPWIRSPPYAESHSIISLDQKTAASSTREDEVYLHLSSPHLEIIPNVTLRCFAAGQTNIDISNIFDWDSLNAKPAFSGGLDLSLNSDTRFLLEAFYTERILAASRVSTWFSDPPPLPQREFRLYAAGLLFSNPDFSLSSDFALSETFAWGTDIYANLGISLSPLLPFGTRARPLIFSLAVDGAGSRFIYREGSSYGEGFRCAARIDWRGRYNSLIRINTVLRGPSPGEEFNRYAANFYYRAPSSRRQENTIKLSRISIYADRNAVNPLKINDSLSGSLGISLSLRQFGITNPLNINLSGSIKGQTTKDSGFDGWFWETTSVGCELTWSNKRYQFRARAGYSTFVGKEEKWNFSLSSTVRFRNGRLGIKAETPDFPSKWNWTISWRTEIRGNQ